jgi:hypothetical protein
MPRNILWDSATEQVLVIDFERARVVIERNQGWDTRTGMRRTVLGDLSNIRIGNGSGKRKRKWKGEEEDIEDVMTKDEEGVEEEVEEEEESDRLFKQELRRTMYEVGTIRDQPIV